MLSPVQRLAQERSQWLPVVKASYDLALRTNNRFAGAWVLWQLKLSGPSLRTLVRYGVLETIDTSRRGHRAYYRMLDPEGVARDLTALGVLN